ncbi:hypothetical protein H7J93_07960 [Mycobacterium barrassiae]|uniref:hypothetical protein n=1 Tax=Mycobacterium barrassiae TaxID=319709 RepID=UPI002265C0F9|nr:hypothetical protein [Mycobacterium barrassiae]MCV7299566.1 hypothetical protein [Mycobacterium barrassiae]
MSVLTVVRKVLAFEMTIAEWIGTAAILAVPYVLVGMVWTAVAGDFLGWHGYARIVSVVVSILSWPVLLLSMACTI